MHSLGCSSVLGSEDWTPCFRERVLNTALPLSALAISLAVFLIQYARSRRKHHAAAAAVAQLDPDASSFQIAPAAAAASTSNAQSSSSSIGRLFSWRKSSDSRNGKAPQQEQETISAATLAVFRTENAMILNEVLATPLHNLDAAELSHKRRLDVTKRSVDTVGAVVLAAMHAAGWAVNSGSVSEVAWAFTWIYFALLGAFSLGTSHSLYSHKAAFFFVYFCIALSNLRSALISDDQSREAPHVTLAALKLAASVLLLIPTVFFPLETKVPAAVEAIHETMAARTQFGEPTTAIPTPAKHRSPATTRRNSTDERQPLLEADEAERGFAAAEEAGIERPPAPPEVRASLYSRISFGFVTPALLKHYKVQFTLPAVPDLPPGDKAANVVAAFRADSSRDAGGAGAGSTLIPSKKPLALRLVWHFSPLLALQFVWAFLEAILELSPAVGLRLTLRYISERDAERNGEGKATTPGHMAVLFVMTMGLGQAAAAVCASQALFIGRRICIRLRAILITEIISKSLRRSDIGGTPPTKTHEGGEEEHEIDATAKPPAEEDEEGAQLKEGQRATDGQVVNLVSVDVFKVSEICAYLHFAFPQVPTSILLCLYLLYDLLGPSALVGFACLLLLLPAQITVASFFVKLQKRLLEATDKRLNLTTEVLNCIKTVKFFAWEEAFATRLGKTRSKELAVLRKRSFAWLLSAIFFIGTPVAVTAVTFAVHTRIFRQPLDAETAFTALALFNLLRMPMDTLPDMIVQILSSLVSVRRIDTFLREKETQKYEQLCGEAAQREEGDPVVGFKDATFVFKLDENSEGSDQEATSTFVLRDLNLHFPEGKLSIIAGSVGSGKTCLLMSLLGETQRVAGRTFMPCPIARALEPIDPETGLSETVAYVSQTAWLLGTTVKENILFGSPYEEQRYKKVLKACSLEPDLKILEYHDETEVGEKGTSLSGGQKARVALARALYSPAKYVLIDDALSAVDAHTAEHLYRNYLLGDLMKGRTCVLVTHAVTLVLPGAAYAVNLDNGRVTAAGPAEQLAAQGVFDHETGPRSSAASVVEHKAECDEEDEAPPTIEEIDEEARANEEADIQSRQERKKLSDLEESYGKGAVGIKQYILYIKSFFPTRIGTILFWALAVSTFLISRATDVGVSAALRRWAGSYSAAPESESLLAVRPRQLVAAFFAQPAKATSSSDSSPWEAQSQLVLTPTSQPSDSLTLHYLHVYALWAMGFIFVSLLRDAVVLFGSLRASRNLYERMTKAILNARPQFFDRTPVGRIMNRFSKDLETVDQEIAPTFLFLIDVILQGVVILVVSSYALPAMGIFSIFIVAVYGSIGALYIVSSRDLKRIESVQRSPIFTLVGEVLGGTIAVRAYGDTARFTRHCLRLIDKASRPFFFMWYENRWLSMRVDTFAGLVSLVVGLGLVWNKSIDAALAGFTLSFTIQLVDAALWTVRMITQNEINFNSIERIGEYLDIEAERSVGQQPPAHWPTASGNIVVEGLTARYSPEFEPVLKGVSFEVKPGEKVGIVGRTGSGKSTLALCFFRFLEAEAGSISIDGISIAGVPLKTLRERLTVIPQDAQLFSGTVRTNLDPFSQHEDGELWQALQRVKLASPAGASRGPSRAPTRPSSPSGDIEDSLPSLFHSLEAPIEQGGRNLSSGQRQLVALARGLLKMRDSRVLILDESTANLDSASDRQIQQTIRTEMAPGATILVIAHRLRTIIDFDKILVLDKGNVLEFASPLDLLNDETSSFRELCERSGEMEMLREMAEKAAEKRAKQ